MLAVGNYDVGEQRMSCLAGLAFKPERPNAGFYVFLIAGHKVTEIVAIWGKFPHSAAARASFVIAVEAFGSFMEEDLIGQFFKYGLA